MADLKSKCHLVSRLGLTQPVASLSPWQPGRACMPRNTIILLLIFFLFLHTRLFKMQDTRRTCQALPVYCRFPLSVGRFFILGKSKWNLKCLYTWLFLGIVIRYSRYLRMLNKWWYLHRRVCSSSVVFHSDISNQPLCPKIQFRKTNLSFFLQCQSYSVTIICPYCLNKSKLKVLEFLKQTSFVAQFKHARFPDI